MPKNLDITATKQVIKTLLKERPISYRRDFAHLFGGVMPALFLSQLFYWSDLGDDKEGWIYKTMAAWTRETGMTRAEQETARTKLKKHGILNEKYFRRSGKKYYKIDMDVLTSILLKQSGMSDIGEVKAESSNGRSEIKQSITETTSEITPESTKNAVTRVPAPFQILGEKWCEFAGIEVKDLTDKDWKALYEHDKKGADIEQLKGLSGAAWKEKRHDLTTLYHSRASLLPKIKPKNEKTFYTPEEVDAMEAAND